MHQEIYKIKDAVKSFYNKDKKIIIASFVMGVIISFGFALQQRAYSINLQQSLAQEIIRFHVIPNSDTNKDQKLKMQVKEDVLNALYPKLKYSKNIYETRGILKQNLHYIESVASDTVKNKGYNYTVSASMVSTTFPKIEYENITLPAGEYEALQIVIGNGVGQNWWCVMFPMLCFIDSAKGEVPYEARNEMREVLTKEEYNLIFEEGYEITVGFRSVNWWQNRRDEQKGEVHVF